MARLDKVSLRYARAIADYLGSAKKAQEMVKELSVFDRTVSGHRELEQVLTSEAISKERRRGIVQDVAKKLTLSDEAQHVLSTIADMKRIGSLSGIVRRLELLALEAANVVSVEVHGAEELEADEKKLLEGRFKKLFGKEVAATYHVEPGLIGGIRAEALGRTYDGSVAGWLTQFEEQVAL